MIRLLCFILLSVSLHAQESPYIAHYQDAYGLVIEHQVQAGQSILGLAQHFGADMEYTLSLNADSDLASLNIDDRVKLQINPSLIANHLTQLHHSPVYYIVQKGQTMYTICKIYADKDVSQVMELNQLHSPAIHPGDTLLIGYVESPFYERPIADNSRYIMGSIQEEYSGSDSIASIDSIIAHSSTIQREKIIERGLAYWQSLDNSSQELIVLHKTAPINQTISLYNPMMDRIVEATVVAPIPEKSYPDNISVVISPAVADALGALDKRFIVEMTY